MHYTQHCLLPKQVSHTAVKYVWAQLLEFHKKFSENIHLVHYSRYNIGNIDKSVSIIYHDTWFLYRLPLWLLYRKEFVLDLNGLVRTWLDGPLRPKAAFSYFHTRCTPQRLKYVVGLFTLVYAREAVLKQLTIDFHNNP